MSTLFEYMFKISLCYAIIYLFYFVLLKRVTQYVGNRFFLLASSLLAFAIPLLRIDFFITPETINASAFINSIPSVNANVAGNIFIPEDSSLNIAYTLMILFISGVVVCLCNFFIQLYSFKRIKATAQLIDSKNGMNLYNLNMNIIPFSFGNAVYLNRQLHSENELREIIRHESVHVQQRHTIDVIVAEFICMLNWYNPFVWLIKQAIKQNLEFLADDAVINNGADKKDYQYLLLKVMGHAPLAIVSNLNFASLKKRIYMMNKTRTSRKHLLKFLFVLPVIALMMFAFRDSDLKTVNENGSNLNTKEETFKLSELTYSIPDATVADIVKKEENKSLLHVGKPFTITLIKNERDRLKSLLKKNGYDNISTHSITFLIDSSLTNNSFSVQVNIDLKTKISAISRSNNLQGAKSNLMISLPNENYSANGWNNGISKTSSYATDLQLHHNNINVEQFSNI